MLRRANDTNPTTLRGGRAFPGPSLDAPKDAMKGKTVLGLEKVMYRDDATGTWIVEFINANYFVTRISGMRYPDACHEFATR